jgi:hypothetical protein
MSIVVNSLTLGQQAQQAKALMMSLVNPDGTLMFPKGLDRAVLVQNTVRSAVTLNTSATQFKIPVTQNSVNSQQLDPTNNLVALQDIHVVTSIGVYVAKPASATDNGYEIYSYAPPTVFSTANVANSINGLYSNGYLRFLNNQQVIAPYWSLKKHYKAPIQQAIAAPYYAANTQPYIPSVDGAIDGTFPAQPGWVFNGGGNVDVSLNLSQALTAVESNQKLIVLFEGFLLQNASQVK